MKYPIIPDKKIEKKIYIIRGYRVMRDSDLAELYGVQAIRLREQVKRNQSRFPKDFVFKLSPLEVDEMVSQNAIPSRKYLGGHLPYVFTDHEAVMLALALHSKRQLNCFPGLV